MRTTLILDPDVTAKARKSAAQQCKPFKEVLNSALRVGLDKLLNHTEAKPYKTKPRPMGLHKGLSYDNVAKLRQKADETA